MLSYNYLGSKSLSPLGFDFVLWV